MLQNIETNRPRLSYQRMDLKNPKNYKNSKKLIFDTCGNKYFTTNLVGHFSMIDINNDRHKFCITVFFSETLVTDTIASTSEEYVSEAQKIICNNQKEDSVPISYGVYYVDVFIK